jgi:uncharacterized membrane protein YhaH (DUF805 family)
VGNVSGRSGPLDDPPDAEAYLAATGLGTAGVSRARATTEAAAVPSPTISAPRSTDDVPPSPPSRRIPSAPGSIGWLFFARDGRIGRKTYIVAMVIAFCAFIAVAPLLAVAGKTGDANLVPGPIVLAALGVSVWMIAVVAIKRWHDAGRRGWWALTVLIPVAGLVVPAVLPSYPGATEFGGAPRETYSPRRAAGAVAVLVALVVVFVAGLRFHAREPAQSQLASATLVDPRTITPSISTDVPNHFLAAYVPFLRSAMMLANLPFAPTTPMSKVYADTRQFSDATRTFSYRTLALKTDPTTESDIRQLVAANNGIIRMLPTYEVTPWATAPRVALMNSAVASANAAARIREDLGITAQQLEQALAQQPVT